MDGFMIRATSSGGSQMHLPQSTGGAGGYATLVMLRFQRDDPRGRAKVITMSVKTGANNGDILYSNTPDKTSMDANLHDFPTQVQQLGPVELSHEPDTFFCYWPFTRSRLRIHEYGVLRAG
jgi:hypothetical protein